MQIVVNVIEKENCFGFEVQVDGGRIESHASVGAWNEQAFESMCHLTAVTVHGKMLALKEAAEQCLHSDAGKSADLQADSNASAESKSQAAA